MCYLQAAQSLQCSGQNSVNVTMPARVREKGIPNKKYKALRLASLFLVAFLPVLVDIWFLVAFLPVLVDIWCPSPF